MNTTVLRRTGEHTGPVVLVAGATSLFMVLIGAGKEGSIVAGPTPTTTVTAQPRTPKPVASGSKAVAPARHRDNTQLVSVDSVSRPKPVTPSGPVPRPTTTTAPHTSSCDVGLSLLALKACLTIGK